MSLLMKEWEARVELISSIAHSQHAIARILESLADMSEHSPRLAREIRHNAKALTALQLTMAESVAVVRLRRPRRGNPAKPLLLSGVYVPPTNRSEGTSKRDQTDTDRR